MVDEPEEFSAAQRDGEDGPPGATASFPYDRMTVERFRAAFPRARWRDDLGAWFVPGTTAARRLDLWRAHEWSSVLLHADARGRDDYAFDRFESPYLVADADLVVRTPFSRAVVAELRQVPWARWDPTSRAWRVPFRSVAELRRRWPAIEAAARDAEPEARRQRKQERMASPEGQDDAALAAERRRHRYPVPADAVPPFGPVLMTHAGPVVFEEVAGEVVDAATRDRFYPGVVAVGAALIWATWRRPTHDELVRAWPARSPATAGERERGWWTPGLDTLREERRRAASLERARTTRRAGSGEPPP